MSLLTTHPLMLVLLIVLAEFVVGCLIAALFLLRYRNFNRQFEAPAEEPPTPTRTTLHI